MMMMIRMMIGDYNDDDDDDEFIRWIWIHSSQGFSHNKHIKDPWGFGKTSSNRSKRQQLSKSMKASVGGKEQKQQQQRGGVSLSMEVLNGRDQAQGLTSTAAAAEASLWKQRQRIFSVCQWWEWWGTRDGESCREIDGNLTEAGRLQYSGGVQYSWEGGGHDVPPWGGHCAKWNCANNQSQ